jgi:hypothetical protein
VVHVTVQFLVFTASLAPDIRVNVCVATLATSARHQCDSARVRAFGAQHTVVATCDNKIGTFANALTTLYLYYYFFFFKVKEISVTSVTHADSLPIAGRRSLSHR